jgi:hypothetical protein
LTVNATTVPRPDTATGVQARLRQAGQIGTGGWTSWPQSPHAWMRRVPSAPDVQNHVFAGVSCGSGRGVQTLRRKPITSVAGGNEPVTPEAK